MKAEYDFLQDKVNFLQDRVNELKAENESLKEQNKQLVAAHDVLLDLLETLKAGLPNPCDNDGKVDVLGYTLNDWLGKISEEVSEIKLEVNKLGCGFDLRKYEDAINSGEDTKAINRLGEEITDLSTVCASFLNWLGWTIYGRAQLQKKVNEKNRKRGYYRDEV